VGSARFMNIDVANRRGDPAHRSQGRRHSAPTRHHVDRPRARHGVLQHPRIGMACRKEKSGTEAALNLHQLNRHPAPHHRRRSLQAR
jgi:hypothetical protein